MMLRGQRSVYTDGGHNNPLLILDGMIFYGELSEINPDDIAQIDILELTGNSDLRCSCCKWGYHYRN